MPPNRAPRDWKVRVDDMLEAIDRVVRYLQGMAFDTFANDPRTQDAVARNFEILGEAANRVPPEIRARYHQVPWSRIRGMRNIVAHGYFALNLSIIWDTAREDLPGLPPLLREILEKEP